MANVIGSAIAGCLAYVFNVYGHVGAWGSFIIVLFGGVTGPNNEYTAILWYVMAMGIGILVQALIYTAFLMHKQGTLKECNW